MISFTIFVVDDEQVVREGISGVLRKYYHVEAFRSGESAIDSMSSTPPDMVLLDVGLPGMSGIQALKKIKQRHPDMIVIMITAFEDVSTVVAAMKLGAYDYVVKPVQMDALLVAVRNAFDTVSMRKEIQALHEKCLKENLPCFIGESNAIQDVMDIVKKAAQSTDTPILIQGETGTGKELIAKAIHYRSPHFKGPMIAVNCASIPKELIESELFGYEKGAFSGATPSGKAGLVEAADKGTLFLDEIGDMSLEAQAKLLRFLEDGEFYKVGGTRKRKISTRIVSATNKDLLQMIQEERFRPDLYHRISVVKIVVPSLNQRRDDILPIAKHFLVEFSQNLNKNFTGIAPQAESILKAFEWKGNVRELKNVIEKGVLLEDGPELILQHLELEMLRQHEDFIKFENGTKLPPLAPSGADFPSVANSIEKYYFDQALKMTNGNECRAAKLLCLSRDRFRYRRKKLATVIGQ
jgi:DNA-binding NtrC family response regulator